MASSATAPLTFDLPVGLIEKIKAVQRPSGPRSVSAVVRLAVTEYNFDRLELQKEPHRQISVRLPADVRTQLSRIAKKKKVSLGELVRVALEALPLKKAAAAPAKAKGKKRG